MSTPATERDLRPYTECATNGNETVYTVHNLTLRDVERLQTMVRAERARLAAAMSDCVAMGEVLRTMNQRDTELARLINILTFISHA